MNAIPPASRRPKTGAGIFLRLVMPLLVPLLVAAPATARSKEPPPELLAALDATGDAETARRAAETLLAEYKSHPRSGDAAEILGHYYYARGEYVTAARQFERAAAEAAGAPVRSRRQCLRGRALLGAGEGGLAARVFEGLLKQDPGSSEARLGLADALVLQGKTERAADIYGDIVSRGAADPATPLALAQLMRTADTLGRHADARAAAAALAADFPQSSEAAAARDRLRRERSSDEPAPRRPPPPGRSGSVTATPAPRSGPESATTKAEPRPGTADSAATAGRFSLQLGAFGDRANARELAARLEAWGLAGVRIEEEKRGGRVYFRVRGGDFADTTVAAAAGTRLKDEHGVSYRVVEQ
jgi:Tfp pilus assembly protein PilF